MLSAEQATTATGGAVQNRTAWRQRTRPGWCGDARWSGAVRGRRHTVAVAIANFARRTAANHRHRHADAFAVARLAARTRSGRDRRAGAVRVAELAGRTGFAAGAAGFSISADEAVIAAGAVRHFGITRSANGKWNERRAVLAVFRIDGARAADAARRHIRGCAAFAAGGRNSRHAALRSDRNENDLFALAFVRPAWRLPGRAANSGRCHFARQATGAADRYITLGAIRYRRIGCRRRALAVHQFPAAARLGAVCAGINLAAGATEITRADRGLPGRAARIRAGGIGRDRGDGAALAVDQDVGALAAWLAAVRGRTNDLPGRADRRAVRSADLPRRTCRRARRRARRTAGLAAGRKGRWQPAEWKRTCWLRRRAQALDGDVAHISARRRVVVFVDIIDEIACQRRRIGGPYQPGTVALQTGDIECTRARQRRAQHRIRGRDANLRRWPTENRRTIRESMSPWLS